MSHEPLHGAWGHAAASRRRAAEGYGSVLPRSAGRAHAKRAADATRAPCGAWRHVAAIRQRAVERYGEVPPHSGGCARRVSGLSA